MLGDAEGKGTVRFATDCGNHDSYAAVLHHCLGSAMHQVWLTDDRMSPDSRAAVTSSHMQSANTGPKLAL